MTLSVFLYCFLQIGVSTSFSLFSQFSSRLLILLSFQLNLNDKYVIYLPSVFSVGSGHFEFSFWISHNNPELFVAVVAGFAIPGQTTKKTESKEAQATSISRRKLALRRLPPPQS